MYFRIVFVKLIRQINKIYFNNLFSQQILYSFLGWNGRGDHIYIDL